jgi:dihydroorotate dehydrogenase (fumarate)
MAELGTTWLGLTPRSPFVLAASPLSRDCKAIVAAVNAGAGAVVMHSMFEEQLHAEQMAAHRFLDMRLDSDAEARSFLPDVDVFSMDADDYLRNLENLKQAVAVPIIASLNGTSPGGWVTYASKLASAGADALELNLYDIATNPLESAAAVEERQIALVESVVQAVSIPVTIKLSPFYTALPAFVRRLEDVGAKGVAVFNRLYQPGVDIDGLDVSRELVLSSSAELPLRLQALALLSSRVRLSLACTGGVHTGREAAKAIACGAHVVQVASVLLERGPQHLAVLRDELLGWLNKMGYANSGEACGVLDLSRTPDPHAWTRLNYMQLLDGWRPNPSMERPT